MALKRKRSESSLSPMPGPSPFDNTPTNISLGSGNTIVINNFPPHIETSQQTYHDVPHLHSRTRKRFRDNRPDDDTIHRNTYERLFSAARSTPTSPIVPDTSSDWQFQSRPEPVQRKSSEQASLHKFWSLPSSTPLVDNEMTSNRPSQNLTCEDCDMTYPVADVYADTCMGGVDDCGFETMEYRCRECRRTVCDNCAVVETGTGRECLTCRTGSRKKWIGGIGWMV